MRSTYRRPRISGAVFIQKMLARMRVAMIGGSWSARTMSSPGLAYTCVSSVRPVAWPEYASSGRGPESASMVLTVERLPDGRKTTSSPGRMRPVSIVPTKMRRSSSASVNL